MLYIIIYNVWFRDHFGPLLCPHHFQIQFQIENQPHLFMLACFPHIAATSFCHQPFLPRACIVWLFLSKQTLLLIFILCLKYKHSCDCRISWRTTRPWFPTRPCWLWGTQWMLSAQARGRETRAKPPYMTLKGIRSVCSPSLPSFYDTDGASVRTCDKFYDVLMSAFGFGQLTYQCHDWKLQKGWCQ